MQRRWDRRWGRRLARVAFAAALGTPWALAAPAPGLAQLPYPWRGAESAAFGDPRNVGVVALEAFGSRLYAATERSPGSGAAELWASEVGERGSWARVTDLRPPLPPSTRAISTLLAVPGGPFYLGTTDATGAHVYRSSDGATWGLATAPETGWRPGRATAVTALAAFGDALYVGTRHRRGAAIWRAPLAGGAFERVLDFDAHPETDAVTALAGYRGRLYAGTHRTRGTGRLWRSADGAPGSWRALPAPRENGRLRPGNATMGAAIAEFGGDLVVSTRNQQWGAELYRTRDGRHWTVEAAHGIAGIYHEEIHDFALAFDDLWMTAPGGPARVWRVESGRDDHSPAFSGFGFGQTNLDGFGRPRTTRDGAPVVAAFRDAVFWGGQDTRLGAQVRRLDRAELERIEATGPGIEFAPGPLRLSPGGIVSLTIRCPESDPLGCHGDVSLRTRRRFRLHGRFATLLVGQTIFDMDSGRSLTLRFRVGREEQALLRRVGRMELRAHNVALDNAENTSATLVLVT